MQEKRLSARLLGYWDKVRKTSDFPDIRRFSTGPIEDIWPHCFRVSIISKAKIPTYKYEYMGAAITDIYGRDLTGLIVDRTTKQFPGKVIHHKFADIVKAGQPLHDNGHFTNDHGEIIKYRACLLPFGNAKRGVTDIVVGLSCRYFR